MAPNKKKKKPASNPARGFATTSTASKPKHDEARELEGGVELGNSTTLAFSATAEELLQTRCSSGRESEKELGELTPEELESRLEDSGLQILVESYGEKTKKNVSRQMYRLQTEKRLLRSQAEHLSIRQWLPPETMQIITDLLQAQVNSKGDLQASPNSIRSNFDFSEDDLLIKLWTLKRLLPLLGFSQQRTDLALRHLLTSMDKLGAQSISSGKESIWALDECLTWLALDCKQTDLPRFDGRDGQSNGFGDQQRSGSMTDIPVANFTETSPESPLGNDYTPQQPLTPDEDSSLSSASESDSDAEPEHLVTRYLELQSRLHEINPELTNVDARRQRRGKGKHAIVTGNLDSTSKRRTEHLTAKIQKIKSDLLFDEDKANSRWANIRIDLAQETAERKKLGIRSDGEKVMSTVQSNANITESHDGDDDVDGMLGAFFTSLPDATTDPATGLSIMSTKSQEGTNVEIRDFGKWTGLTPRRVLEEACKARYDFHPVSLVFLLMVRQRFWL